MAELRSAALVGNPNAGKSALFNALTGARQKIANYPGVTVERKSGRMLLPSGDSTWHSCATRTWLYVVL